MLLNPPSFFSILKWNFFNCLCLFSQNDTPVAKLINELALKAESDVLIIASSEIRPVEGWKEAMVPHIMRRDIGLVTGKISYHDNTLYSCGLTLDTTGISNHWHRGWPSSDPGFGGWLAIDHEVSAVPWQFMGIRRDLFLKSGCLDDKYRFRGCELDFSLRLSTQLNLRHLAVPSAKAVFVNGYPQNKPENWHPEDLELLQARWDNQLRKGDPYLNPNFSVMTEDVSMIDQAEKIPHT